ncbi:unnamed protein product [Amoebophrya sp. A25]|nr:unnamed protein product [Amoebophrya sp. A25]|eukprot:GSA25T00006827001.1
MVVPPHDESASIDFFETAFFQRLRSNSILEKLPEKAVVLVPVFLEDSSRTLPSLEAHILQPLSLFPISYDFLQDSDLSRQEESHDHSKSQRERESDSSSSRKTWFLNLFGEQVAVGSERVELFRKREKDARPVEKRQRSCTRKILAEENYFDGTRSIQILVLDGCLQVESEHQSSSFEDQLRASRPPPPPLPPNSPPGNHKQSPSPRVGQAQEEVSDKRKQEEIYKRRIAATEALEKEILASPENNPDYLVLFPGIEKQVFDEVEALRTGLIHIQGRDTATFDRIDAVIASAAAQIYKQLSRLEQEGQLTQDVATATTRQHQQAEPAAGTATATPPLMLTERSERFFIPRVLLEDPQQHDRERQEEHEAALILHPELLVREHLRVKSFTLDHVHDAIARTVYTLVNGFLFPCLMRSTLAAEQACQQVVTKRFPRFIDLVENLASSASGTSWKILRCAKTQKAGTGGSSLNRVEMLAKKGASILCGKLNRSTEPVTKLEVFLAIVQHRLPKWIARVLLLQDKAKTTPAAATSKPPRLEADDLITVLVLILWAVFQNNQPSNTNQPLLPSSHIAAHLLHCELFLAKARTVPREAEYAFSLFQSAKMFFRTN